MLTDFRLSWRLIININSVLGLLHCVDVWDIAVVSEKHATYTIQFEVCEVSKFLCIYRILFWKLLQPLHEGPPPPLKNKT